jgi:hypothetical protein
MPNPNPKAKGKTNAQAHDTAAALSILSAAGKPQREEALSRASTPAPAARKAGRPRREAPTVQRTVSFTEGALQALKRLSLHSGRQGYEAPDFSKTVRVAIRLASTHSAKEIQKAFDAEMDG